MSKDIKNRIISLSSTRQITKAMEMVATSKLRRAQTQMRNSRPYFEALRSTMDGIMAVNRDFSSPFLQARPVQKALYIVIAGDRGLAGGYNSNIFKLVQEEIKGKDTVILPIGKKCVDHFRSRNAAVWSESYADAAEVNIADCFSLARQLSDGYLKGEFDEIYVIYTAFISALSQVPAAMKLLPLTLDRNSKRNAFRSDTIYEPNPEEVFAAIIHQYLGGMLYGALCESRAAEQAARRTAMESATANAEDMIDDLRLKFNRARQAAITQEITEIVAGS